MSLSKNQKLVSISKQLCRNLRKRSTPAEKIFWDAVRNRKFLNKKFYRQYPLFFDTYGKETFFVAGFFCFEEKIDVEIDGGYYERQREYYLLRMHIINELEINVIMFTNEEVLKSIHIVLEKLKDSISSHEN